MSEHVSSQGDQAWGRDVPCGLVKQRNPAGIRVSPRCPRKQCPTWSPIYIHLPEGFALVPVALSPCSFRREEGPLLTRGSSSITAAPCSDAAVEIIPQIPGKVAGLMDHGWRTLAGSFAACDIQCSQGLPILGQGLVSSPGRSLCLPAHPGLTAALKLSAVVPDPCAAWGRSAPTGPHSIQPFRFNSGGFGEGYSDNGIKALTQRLKC